MALADIKNNFEWNILCYTFTDNNLEIGSFRDLAKLTSIEHNHKNIIIHMIIDTQTMGTYFIKIHNNPYKDGNISMTRLSNINMSREKTLEHFISKSIDSVNFNRIALILGGHGSGWYLKTEKESVMSIKILNESIKKCQLNLDLLIFDNCMMANLESLYEIRDVAKIVIAYEDYAGWKGIMEPKTLLIFDKINLDTKIIAKELANNLLNNLTNEDDPTDVSVLLTQNVNKLVEYLKIINIKKPVNNIFCIDTNYWQLQDLYSIVENSIEGEDFEIFNKLFHDVMIFYKQSFNKNNDKQHGLSCIVDPETDQEDIFKTWKQLSFLINFV